MQLIQETQASYYKAVAMEFPRNTVVYFRFNRAQVIPTTGIVLSTCGDLVLVEYEDKYGRRRYKSANFSGFSKEFK